MTRSLAKPHGIALLEVLLAVTVIGVGLGAVFNSLSESSRVSSWMEREMRARQLVEGQLHQLRASGALNAMGESRGSFDSPYTDYGWSSRVESAVGTSPQTRVTLTVTFGDKRRPLYSMQAYLLRP